MFRRRRREVRVDLSAEEADLLRGLIREYLQLLDAGAGGDGPDPVRARLFPRASLEDDQVDREYREMAGGELDRHKRQTAAVALASLGEEGGRQGTLADEERDAWLVLLTDLRLALGVRLGVTEETMETPPNPRDPEQAPMLVLTYLTALQESLVRAAMR